MLPPALVTPASPPAVDVAIIDHAVDPCTDFYRYACGGWLASTPIPPDRPTWSRSFSEIDERNLVRLRDILDADAAAPPPGDVDARKLGDLYGTCMDEAKAETSSAKTLAQGMRPLTVLSRWSSLTAPDTRPVLARLVAELQLAGADALFAFGSQQDFRNADQVIGAADQGGLGLPDRSYYLKGDARSVQIREAYRGHVAQMFELAGTPATETRGRAEVVLSIETALARASLSPADRRDPNRLHHRLDRAGLERLAPNFDWKAYFERLGHPEIQSINVMVPAFFEALNETLSATRPADLESYLVWHLVAAAAPALGRAFVEESFRFRARNFTGETQLLPRWKRCLSAVDQGMGQALGRPFVAASFGAEGKTRADGLVTTIEGAFRTTLGELAWMDAPTRKQALEKLALIYNQIGYPARWRDYGALFISRESDLRNRMNAAAFEMERDLGKIGNPVDRGDWEMPPQMVNAYYDPAKNEMVFPAGILQPPFFARLGPPALNDGGIGVVMGHELTHGFDDEGRKFDGHGNLRDWWTPAVARAFEDRVACVVAQFDAYPVAKDLHVDGRLTAGENIADQGGLRLAYDVFHAQTPVPDSRADGLTADQRFFLAFAQAWCTNRREPYARMLATVDPHAPPQDRVNGSASSLDAFQRAFSCRTDTPMAPAHRCRVW
ncbi:MAG TPA: M13 family metallopeptidase [Polyangia bacterium]|nr:M13 family metallopeptidase [Polyangia bacterium]